MKYFITVFTFLIIITTTVFAQKDTSSERITVFDNGANTVFKNQKIVLDNLLIKFNPYDLIIGDFPVFFERPINNNWSVEAAPGLTFRDVELDVLNQASISNLTSFPYNSDSKSGIGYSFNADARYYPGKDNMMDGIYLSPEISFRHYVIEYPESGPAPNTTTYSTGHTNATDFKLILGHESDEWIDGFYIDYYFGIGARLISGVEYADVTTQVNYFGTTIINTTWSQEHFSFFKPAFYWGIKLGFGIK